MMSWELADNIRGPKGDKGDTGTIAGVSVTTLPPEAPAAVSMTGPATSRVVQFGIPKGEKGDQGVPGTLSSASADAVPAGAPAEVIMSGTTEVKHAHFKIPRGLPGVNAIENDQAMAEHIRAVDSDTRLALNDEYPVRRVWDGQQYPNRAPDAVNIFFGPVRPGIEMDPEVDYWANPDGTTVDEVTAKVQDVSSPLYAAVRTAAAPDRIDFTAAQLAAVDNRPPTLGTLSPTTNLAMGVPVLLFGDNVVQVAGVPWRSPVGWSSCRVYIDYAHTVSAVTSPSVSWQARLTNYENGTDLSVTPGLQTLAMPDNAPPGVRIVKRFMIPGNFLLNPAGAEVRLAVSRLSTTFGGPVGLIKMTLERTA